MTADARLTYGQILGRNVSAARGRLRLSQAAVGARMKALGFQWHQQTAGQTETGRRRVTGEELLALSYALETSVRTLMTPLDEDRVVAFPSGEAVSVQSVRLSVRGSPNNAVTWDGATPKVFSGPLAEGSDLR
jgi:hypothetical protein